MEILVAELHHRGSKMVYHTLVCLKGTSASSTLPAAAATQPVFVFNFRFPRKRFYISRCRTLRQLELEKKVQELDDLQHMLETLQQTMDAIPEEIVAQYRTAEKGENAYSHQK